MNSESKLTSYNFARFSDFVFAETVTHQQFQELNIDTKYIIEKNSYQITYKLDYLEICENNVVFCNSNYINDLFYLMRKVKNLKNIKLITHQTDLLINKKLYEKKPEMISEWYSINVGFKNDRLIPIPIGLANDYSPKNVKESEINKFDLSKKETKLYINFNSNTNKKFRSGLYNVFKNYSWTIVKDFNLEIEEYKNDLGKYTFVLAPWGNGIDTHRFWEAIYSGSIPITKYHLTYNSAENLPVFFVENLSSLKEVDLENFLINSSNTDYNYEKLNILYWIELINKSNIESKEYAFIKFTKFTENYFKTKHSIVKYFESKSKKIKYFIIYPIRIFKKLTLN